MILDDVYFQIKLTLNVFIHEKNCSKRMSLSSGNATILIKK